MMLRQPAVHDDADPNHESEAHYRLIADNATDVVMQLGPDESTIEWVAPSIEEILGWRPQDVIGTSYADYLTAEGRGEVRKARENVVADIARVDEVQHRRADGSYVWMSGRSRRIFDPNGNPIGRVVALRDIDDRVATRKALIASEERFRLLAENASDAVLQTDETGDLVWASPSVAQVLGLPPASLLGKRVRDFVIEEDRGRILAAREQVIAGLDVERVEVRFTVAGGERRWMAIRARPVMAPDGTVASATMSVRDCHAEVLARRAAATLSAGSGIVATASDEDQLLADMCRTAVDEGGYVFCWYGRRIDDEQHSVAKLAHSTQHSSYLDEITVSWADDEYGRGPTGLSLRTGRTVIVHDFAADATFGPWRAAAAGHGFRSSITLPVRVEGVVDGAFMVYAGEPHAFDDHAVALLEDLAAQIGSGLGRLRDHQRLVSALATSALLTNAIEQANDAIVVTDTTPVVRYANPAALRASGCTLDEVLGRSPGIMQGGLYDETFYEVISGQLGRGLPWTGVLSNRRPDGELYEEDVTVTPVRDDNGVVVAYVAVKRDLTVERRLEADLSRELRNRGAVRMLMRRVRPAATLEATANALAAACRDLDGIDAAAMLLARPDGRISPVGLPRRIRTGADRARRLVLADFGPLASRVEDGPWLVDLLSDNDLVSLSTLDPVVVANMISEGYTALAFVPVRRDGHLVGFLSLGTKDPWGRAAMGAMEGLLEELGAFAANVLGEQAARYAVENALRLELQDIIEQGRFDPVYQPVVDLRTGDVRGYEALTRFHDGRRPDVRFLDAHSVETGAELEAACAAKAIAHAAGLPPDLWLSLNFSPAAIITGHAAAVVAGAGRPVVIEITERVPIESYPLVRRALLGCKDTRVSIDDAGAGYASLQHILELRPDMVKLDIAIVNEVDKDPARQALVAGLVHFARQTDTEIIAEGVETQAEAQALVDLGVHLAQGFLFGRPARLG